MTLEKKEPILRAVEEGEDTQLARKGRPVMGPAEIDEKLDQLFAAGVLKYNAMSGLSDEHGGLSTEQAASVLAHDHRMPHQASQRALVSRLRKQKSADRKIIADRVLRIESKPTCDRELRRWVRAMCGDIAEDKFEANVWALKQWMWQVKRHARQMSVEWQICITIWSKTHGTGKSQNMMRLCSPFDDRRRSLSWEQVTKPFSGESMANTLIVTMDETEISERQNVERAKAVISNDPWQDRRFRSAEILNEKNITSFIGTSNHRPPHGFNDPSGARRLWSIHVLEQSMDEDPERAEILDTIDMEKVWNAYSSDSSSPHSRMPRPTRDYMAEVRANVLKASTLIDSWAEERLVSAPGAKTRLTKCRIDIHKYHARAKVRFGKLQTLRLKELFVELREKYGKENVVNSSGTYYLKDWAIRESEDDA